MDAKGTVMSKKLTGDDVNLLNEYINSANKELSKKGRDELMECLSRPNCFADRNAEDWARRIFARISKMNLQ